MREKYYYEIKPPVFDSPVNSFTVACSTVKSFVVIPQYDSDLFIQQLKNNDKSIADYEWVRSCIQIKEQKETLLLNYTDHIYIKKKDLWPDLIDNEPLIPIVSLRMKEIIEKNLTGKEGVFFIEITVIDINNIEYKVPYFILRFNKMLDLLNYEETTYLTPKRFIHKPVFDSEKVRNYAIAPKPDERMWNVSRCFYVNKKMRKEFKDAGLVGIKYVKHRIK